MTTAGGFARTSEGARAPVLVLGLGNLLLRDEGVGVHAVRELAKRPDVPSDVELLDGGTAGMDLLDAIAARDLVIVIDALRAHAPAGTVLRLAGAELDTRLRERISPHQLGLSELLATLQLAGDPPRAVVLIGVVPHDLSLGLELSGPVSAGLEQALALVLAEIAAYHAAEERRAAGEP